MADEAHREIRLDACDISDACDDLGIDAVRTGVLRPLWPGCPPVSGPVVTVQVRPGRGTPLPDLVDALAAAADSIVLVDLGGRADVQCWGTFLATIGRRFGVRAALVNGAARDVAGLQELGFPTYARGVHPARMRGRLELVAAGAPVDIDGSVVEPGALAVVDESGAVFFPPEHEAAVVALAADLRLREHEQLRAIEAGADLRSTLGGAGEPRAE